MQGETDNARTLRGILFMLATVTCFSVTDSIAKYVSPDYPAFQIVWTRYVFQSAFLLLFLLLTEREPLRVARTGRLRLQLGRATINIVSNCLFVFAVGFVPLADAVALGFVAPLIVTALSVPLLRERVGVRRWSAVLVGFAGAMVMIRPGSGVLHWASSLIIVVAGLYALYMIVTRVLSETERPATTLFYVTAMGLGSMSLVVPFVWTPAPIEIWALMAGQGAMSGLAHWCLIKAFEHAPVSVVAPFNYAQIVSAVAIGYAVWGEVPDLWSVVGALIIVLSGLYVMHREAVAGRGSSARVRPLESRPGPSDPNP
ncbi:MAG: DMT family transporter [Alphaproteobacteria bacterium]